MSFKKMYLKLDKLSEKQMWSLVVCMMVISVIIRALFTLSPRSAYVTPDEMTYLNVAKSYSYYGDLSIHNITTVNKAILYSLIISPFMRIGDLVTRGSVVGIINSFMMSSTVIPVYLICKKIISRNSIKALVLFTILLLPDMTMSMTFMAENLFYPLSAWLFLAVYDFILETRTKIKVTYCISIAVLCNILYMTKIISLYFVIAFSMMIIIDIVVMRLKKVHIAYLFIFLISFFALKQIIENSVYIGIFGIGNTLSSFSSVNITLEKIPYLIYCCIFNMVCSVLAFFYFPIFLPIQKFGKLPVNIKRLVIFAFSSLITVIGAIVILINSVEQYGSLELRQHLRYFSPLLILFLILYYYINFELNEGEEESEKNYKKNIVILIISFLSLECFYFFFKLFYGVSVDGVLLQYIYLIYSRFIVIKPNYRIIIESVLKLFFTITILFGTVLYLFGKRHGKNYITLFILLICLINNACATISFRTDYGYNTRKTKELLAQVETIDEFLEGNSGNVLIVTDGYNMAVETYLTHKAYYTTTEQLLHLIDGKDFIDLQIDKIQCNYPYVEYTDLSDVDIVITDKSIEMYNIEHVNLTGINDYDLYINDSDILSYGKKSTFPNKVGQVKELSAEDSNIYSNFPMDENGNYTSLSDFGKGNVLIYGPYDYMSAGEYEITFFYSYNGGLEEGSVIGSADINIIDTSTIIVDKPFFVGEESVTFNVVIPEDYNSVETRLHANVEGITFKKIKIIKLK